VEAMRFWKTVEMNAADAGPGGRIAGRETVLYQMRENRPDSTATIQRWVDADHGILLKSVTSIYSKQVETEISRETLECQAIQFGAVDPAALAI
jgi:hypothetical protein